MDFAIGRSRRRFDVLTANNPLPKLNGVDANSLPPREAELQQHIHRCAFVAKMWAAADQQTIDQHSAPENGWDLVNNQ